MLCGWLGVGGGRRAGREWVWREGGTGKKEIEEERVGMEMVWKEEGWGGRVRMDEVETDGKW